MFAIYHICFMTVPYVNQDHYVIMSARCAVETISNNIKNEYKTSTISDSSLSMITCFQKLSIFRGQKQFRFHRSVICSYYASGQVNRSTIIEHSRRIIAISMRKITDLTWRLSFGVVCAVLIRVSNTHGISMIFSAIRGLEFVRPCYVNL